jgi:hypothetical protein
MLAKVKYYIIVLTVIFLIAFGLFGSVYVDRVYMDKYSGSAYGYREWPFKITTNKWEHTSLIELRLRSIPSYTNEHKWASMARTHKTLFGIPTTYAHGNPGRVMELRDDWIKNWITKQSDEKIMELYVVLKSGDRDRIKAKVSAINEEIFNEDE